MGAAAEDKVRRPLEDKLLLTAKEEVLELLPITNWAAGSTLQTPEHLINIQEKGVLELLPYLVVTTNSEKRASLQHGAVHLCV